MRKNDLSFSFSRHGTFKSCPRQYYLNYYGSRNGWFKSSSKRTQKIYFLKKLTNIYAWAGNIAHDAIEYALKRYRDKGEIVELDELLKVSKDRMKKEFKESQERVIKHKQGEFYAYKHFGLLEHEYNKPITKDLRKSIWQRVKTCLTNFFSSEIYKNIINNDPSEWKAIEDFSTYPVQIDEKYAVSVYSVPDFAMKKDGKIYIYDWKTGKPNDKYRTQLSMYAIYASAYWGVDPSEVVCTVYYLLSNKQQDIDVSQETLEDTRQKVIEATKEMITYLKDGDPVKNDPIDESKFSLTEDSGSCFFCPFLKVCGKK